MTEEPKSSDTRERLILLESQVTHMIKEVDKMSTQVNEMHSLLLQAKGAKWLVLTLATVFGFLAGKIAMMSWLPK